MMKIDLPSALCPVTTRRIFFCIRTSFNLREPKYFHTLNLIPTEGRLLADRR